MNLDHEPLNRGKRAKRPLTFAKVSDALSIYRGAVIIHISHEELSEMLDNRTSNPVVGNPFNDGLGFNIAELFQRNLLKYKSVSEGDR